MNRSIILVVVLAVFCMKPLLLGAQEAVGVVPITIEESVESDFVEIGRGQGLYDAGTMLLYAGGTYFAIGVGCVVADLFVETHGGWSIFPVIGALFGVVGAAAATIGVPLYLGGRYIGKREGSQFVTIGSPRQGWASVVDVGLGVDAIASLHGIYGYNFNKNIFAGVGVGYDWGLLYDYVDADLPLYANVRLQLGNRRIAPYLGLRGGVSMLGNGLYGGVDVGVRQQSIDKRGEWWISSSFTVSHRYHQPFLGIRVARSF